MNEQVEVLAKSILKAPILQGKRADIAINNLSGFLAGYVAGNKNIGVEQQKTILEKVLNFHEIKG